MSLFESPRAMNSRVSISRPVSPHATVGDERSAARLPTRRLNAACIVGGHAESPLCTSSSIRTSFATRPARLPPDNVEIHHTLGGLWVAMLIVDTTRMAQPSENGPAIELACFIGGQFFQFASNSGPADCCSVWSAMVSAGDTSPETLQ